MKSKSLFYISIIFICLIFTLNLIQVQGQTYSTLNSFELKGKVIDNEGSPVIGAGIMCVDNKKIGTISDIDGNFILAIPRNEKTIIITSLGMESRKISVSILINALRGGSNWKNNVEERVKDGTVVEDGRVIIELAYKKNMLDKVVVTGYGQTTVKQITGSVSILEKFEDSPLSSIEAIMQGEAAGVNISAVSGRPGSESRIRIRGTNNLSGRTEPLWVIDGVPIQDNAPQMSKSELATGGFDNIFLNGIGSLNPNDIENITILKDAAAAAIYGSKAANGVIVVTTKKGNDGKARISYSNNFALSFRPQRRADLMNSTQKLQWEEELWEEFSANKYERYLSDNTVIFPIVGIVGQIRSGSGIFTNIAQDKNAQDELIKKYSENSTDWYNQIFRNAFQTNHHLSLSGGGKNYTYYTSIGYNNENGMLINDNYQRYNLNADFCIRPVEKLKLDFGLISSVRCSKSPYSYVNPFLYAHFANPYEQPYKNVGEYGSDRTWFSLGYFNGRGEEEVLPKNGFNILRELNENYSKTKNHRTSLRAKADWQINNHLIFTGLASYTHSDNSTDKIVDKHTYTAFKDRLGHDKYTTDKLYGSISQNTGITNSYIARGHFAYNRTFAGQHNVNIMAGAELRGSDSKTIFSKRYNYDPSTGSSSLPEISGPADEWARQVERLNGQYYTKDRFASFYASADYFLGNKYVFNTSFRTDGSSHFGSNKQFNPTWSAGAAWHFGEETWMKAFIPALSHGTVRLAAGFTGDINRHVSHQLIMKYLKQRYRYFDGESFELGYIPAAPNPNLGWEKTMDLKFGIDFGLWDEKLTAILETYGRKSSDVISYSQVQSTTGFSNIYFNSADIMNSGFEMTLRGKIIENKDFKLKASTNFAYNFNKVTKYRPGTFSTLTSKDRYVEDYPAMAIFSGKYAGIDPITGLHLFRLREDADIQKQEDLNNPDNYRYYLGTSIAPYTGGFNITANYKQFRLSVSGVYSLGAKSFDKIVSPASYLQTRHEGMSTEEVQSQYCDLYSNHLNVNSDRVSRWTEDNPYGAKYPRIYDYYDKKYNFAVHNPMDANIVDAIYLKKISYMRIKTIILTYSLPQELRSKLKLSKADVNMSFNNFFTLTNYDGMDPEVPGARYPTTRSISFGLNIGF